MVYGTKVNLPIDVSLSESSVPEAAEVIRSLQDCWQRVRDNLLKAQASMTSYADKHRKESKIRPDMLVMLDTKNLSLAACKTKKLKPRFVGPFKVLRQVGLVSFKIALPDSMKVHPVFHVSLLK